MPHIVGVGGTTRPGSTTEKALAVVLDHCERMGASTHLFTGPDLAQLPLYAPENPDRTPDAKKFVAEMGRADGLVIGSSAYHGSISGLVKNALDYTQDLSDDPRPYFSDRAVGVVATGGGWQGVVTTIEHLRSVVHALRGWVTPMGGAVNSSTKVFDADGQPTDDKVAFGLRTVAEEVMAFAGWRAAAR